MKKYIVYHSAFKIGIINQIQERDDLINVIFKEGSRTLINKDDITQNKFLICLSDDFESYIINKNFNDDYTNEVIHDSSKVASNYYTYEFLNSNTIKGRIYSTTHTNTRHTVTLSFNENLNTYCTCGKQLCKHSYKIIKDIYNFYRSNTHNEIELKLRDINGLIGKKSFSCFYENFTNYVKMYSILQEIIIKENYNTILDALSSKKDFESLFPFIVCYCNYQNSSFLEELKTYSNKDTYLSNLYESADRTILFSHSNSSNKRSAFFGLIKLLFNEDYTQLLFEFLNQSHYFSYIENDALNYLIPKSNIDKIIYGQIQKLINDRFAYLTEESVASLLPLAQLDDKIKLQIKYPKYNIINFESLNDEENKTIFLSLDPINKLNFLQKNKNRIKDNPTYYIESILNNVNKYYSFQDYEHLYDCLNIFKEAPYYLPLFINHTPSYFISDKFNDIEGKITIVNYQDLEKYYKFDVYSEESYYGEITFYYQIYLQDKEIYNHSFNSSIYSNISKNRKTRINTFLNTLEELCIKKCNDKKEQILLEIEELKKQKEQKQKSLEISSYLNSITNKKIYQLTNSFSSTNKNKLELHFDQFNYVFLKLGNQKLYKVKKTNSFINAVRDKEFLTINNSLEINCDIDNFDEISKKTCEILLKNYTSDNLFDDSKIKLNPQGISEIIKLYQGIYIDKFFYHLDEERTFNFEITKDKTIKINPEIKINDIIHGNNEIYILDRMNLKINPLKNNDQIYDIFNFFTKFNGYKINDNENSFISSIYSGNEAYITLNCSLEQNKENDQQIELYFDLEDSVITSSIIVKENDNIISSLSYSQDTNRKINQIYDILEQLHFEDDQLVDMKDIMHFLTIDFSLMKILCTVFISENIKKLNIIEFPKQNLRMKHNSSMIDTFFEESIFSNEELEKIINAIKKKKNYIQLKNNYILSLTNDNAQDFFEITNSLHLDKKQLLNNQNIDFYNALKVTNKIKDNEISNYFSNVIDDIKNFKEKDSTFDPSFNDILKPYQKEGVNWLKTLSKYNLGGILADDMGLGKTLQTIALLKDSDGPSLIICPKSLIFNWYNEFKKFDNTTQVIKIYGSQFERKNIINTINEKDKIIYITSYDSLRNDLEHYKITFNYIILDEAQAIKTFSSKKAQSVKLLKAKHRFSLTGTPIENNALELWSIFDFLMPGYLDDIETFKKSFEKDDIYQKKVKKRIAPFILRRTKKEVLNDLPDKYEHIIEAEMDSNQRKVYDAYCKKAKDNFELTGDIFSTLPMLMRLRQICVDPHMFISDYQGESAKMNIVYDTINNLIINQNKCLIFSQFVKALDIIEVYLKENNIPYYKITGETKAERRIEMVDKFNIDSTPIFLISLKAGGNGLNLTGADTVIHIDPWWNSAAEEQATDRAYRIGQTKNVNVIKFICQNSIEERIIELQNEKKNLIDSLISSSDKSITSLSHEDIKFLLK